MVTIPGTIGQLLVLLLFVMPGIVYAAVRSTLQGPTPDDRDTGVRVLRAMMTSAALDALYLVALGPHLVGLARDSRSQNGVLLQGWSVHVREIALLSFLLVFAIPGGLAYMRHGVLWKKSESLKVRLPTRHRGYHPKPTAWDFAAPGHLGRTFVRIKLSTGALVGGWLGAKSFVSSYPEERDIFIDNQWLLASDGTFLGPVPGSQGIFVNLENVEYVEWMISETQANVIAAASASERQESAGR